MNEQINPISAAEREAKIFMDFALELSKASSGDDAHEKLVALEHNLKLWVEIETSLKSAKNLLPDSIKENLYKLSKYVERLILSKGVNNMTKSDYDISLRASLPRRERT